MQRHVKQFQKGRSMSILVLSGYFKYPRMYFDSEFNGVLPDGCTHVLLINRNQGKLVLRAPAPKTPLSLGIRRVYVGKVPNRYLPT